MYVLFLSVSDGCLTFSVAKLCSTVAVLFCLPPCGDSYSPPLSIWSPFLLQGGLRVPCSGVGRWQTLWVFVVWQYLNLDVGKIFFLCLNLMCPGFLFIKVCFHCPMTYTGFIRNLPSSVLLFICWQDLQIANPAAPFVIVLSPPSLLCLFDIWNTVIVAVLTSLLITTCQFGVDFGWFFLCGPYFSPFMPLMFGCSICEFYLVEY